MYFKLFLIIFAHLSYFPKNARSSTQNQTHLSACKLPSNCRFQKVNSLKDANGIEKMFVRHIEGLHCDIHKRFSFDFNMSEIGNQSTPKCLFKLDNIDPFVELSYSKRDSSSSFYNSSAISNLFQFIQFFSPGIYLNVINFKRFEYVNRFYLSDAINLPYINEIVFINCKFEIYFNQTTLRTCDDFNRSNLTNVHSIAYFGTSMKSRPNVTIINGGFKQELCPLFFNDSSIRLLKLVGFVDSFYKRNVLSFSNHTFPNLTSRIKDLELDKVEDINLDFNLLNPDIFKLIETIYIYGSIKRIDGEIFKTFKEFYMISFKTNYFRKIMHKNGIDWIRAINSDISTNMSNETDIYDKANSYLKTVNLDCFFYSQEERMPKVFPDEDFCLYVDYPFDQAIVLIQLCGIDIKADIPIEYSCTFVWLMQLYELYYNFYSFQLFFTSYFIDINFFDLRLVKNLKRHLTPLYNSTKAKCNFTLMKSLCDKSGYKVIDIWGLYDYSILNKKFEIAFKISSYVFSLLGIITNLIVIIAILHKTNTDIFKGFKQYNYLCYNSIFSMLILVIQLLSWMSECFYPYEVFCPEIRKLVFIQVFKMVFKECFVTAFRFMWSFSYVAFALNRISLIGKDHGKLVQFMSDVGVKSYLAVCFVISCGFSVIKYFKYEINYDQPETSYPILNDHDLSSIHRTQISNDGVIIANSIFDILNYVVFEVIIFIVDIFMVVLLKRTLDEKLRKSEKLLGNKDQNKLDTMKKEHEDAIHKVIKMVILNTAISLLFRLPIAFIPVVNVVAEFYYKDYFKIFYHPLFGEFYSFLLYSGYYDLIVECSHSLFNFSLFVQLFIYIKFDKKINLAIRRFPKIFKKDKKNN